MAFPPRPSCMDLTMHRMAQTDPSTSQTIGVVLHLDGTPPSLGDLRGHVADHLRHEPRLTHHLHGPGLGARWRHEPAPDLDVRVRARDVPPGDSHLDDALHELVERPLPDEGPPWDLWLLSGYAADRYALCYRAHHSVQDGIGVIGTLNTLFGAAAAPPAAPPAVRTGPRAYLRTVRGALAACAANGVWADPARPLSGGRTVTWTSVPTAPLRTAAVARGGDTGDAFLAALSGALRTWSAEHWPTGAGRPLPALTMINLRRAGESARPGNLFAFAPLALPCQEPTALDRLDRVIAQTRETKDPARRSALRRLTDLTPARAFHAMAGRLTTPARASMSVSYLAIHRPLAYRGDPVTRVQPFTWLPRHQPASVVACSYGGETSVCFATDAALPAGRGLAALFAGAAEELAGGPAVPPAEPPSRSDGPAQAASDPAASPTAASVPAPTASDPAASVPAVSDPASVPAPTASDPAASDPASMPAVSGPASDPEVSDPASDPEASGPAPAGAAAAAVVVDFAFIKDLLVDHGALPAEPITRDATQAQAGIDSMAVTALSMALEDRLGLDIAEHDLAEAPTVADLVDLVTRRAAVPTAG